MASLTAITVNGASVPGVAGGYTGLNFGVAHDVTSVTVVGTPAAGSSVICVDDTDTDTDGCQITLGAAGTATSARLNATRGTDRLRYTIAIQRGRSGTFEWKGADDIYGLPIAGAQTGRGLVSDGVTLWAAAVDPLSRQQLRAFDLATGLRQSGKDITLTPGSASNPFGLALHEDLLLVADANGNRVYAYTRTNGQWQASPDREVTAVADLPGHRPLRGLWTDGETLWVVNNTDRDLTAYSLADGQRDTAKDISLHADNAGPGGAWSDGETIWVANGDKIFAYDLLSGDRVTTKEFSAENLAVKGTNEGVWGIWSDGETMWAMAGNEDIYSYYMPDSDNTDIRAVRTPSHVERVADQTATTHTIDLPNTPSTPTLAIEPRQLGATSSITAPDDASATDDGHQVDLSSTATVSVTITAQDGSTGAHTLTVNRLPGEVSPTATAGARSITVTWTAPDAGTSNITAYHVRYAPSDAMGLDDPDNWTVVENAWTSGTLSYVIRRLTGNQEYYVQVRAVNSSGSPPWPVHADIAQSATATPLDTPGTPDATARLSAITVLGKSVPSFRSDRTGYEVGVANSQATPTVIGTAETDGATVTCDIDDDLDADGCQVPVDVDDRTDLVLSVTNGTATGAYLVTLNRGRSGTFQWKASEDIYALVRGADKDLRGLWSDGTTMLAVNNAGGNSIVFEVDLETKGREAVTDLDITTFQATIRHPQGLAFAGGELLVAMRDGAAGDSPREAGVARWQPYEGSWRYFRNYEGTGTGSGKLGNRPGDDITGIWSDGALLWAAGDGPSGRVRDGEVRAFDISNEDEAWVPGRSFTNATLTAAGNTNPAGLWSDNVTMWVADSADDRIYAYDMDTRDRVTGKEFDVDDLRVRGERVDIWGIWSDGETMWVASEDGRIYSYQMPLATNTDLLAIQLNDARVAVSDYTATSHDLIVPNAVTPTVTIEPRQPNASGVVVTPADADANQAGHQVSLTTATTVTVRITAQDGVSTGTHTLEVERLAGLVPVTFTEGPARIRVDWTAPDAGTSPITRYDLRYREATDFYPPEDSWTVVRDVGSDSDLSHLLEGLKAYQNYLLQVRAVTDIGEGPWYADRDVSTWLHPQTLKLTEGVTTLASIDVAGASAFRSDFDVVGFGADATTYRLAVAHDTSSLTITPSPTDSDATVSCSSDTDANTDGCQITLGAAGTSTALTIDVTSGTTQSYTVNVFRGTDEAFGRKASDDIYALTGLSLTGRGIWSDGDTLWMPHNRGGDSRVYAIDLATGARDEDSEFAIGGLTHTVDGFDFVNETPLGITGRDGVIWIPDSHDNNKKTFAYEQNAQDRWVPAPDWARKGMKDVQTTQLRGPWTDGEILWVAHDGVATDYRDGYIYAYHLVGPGADTRLASEDFTGLRAAGVLRPFAIWSDGETMWVSDIDDKMIYAYDMATKRRVEAQEFSADNLAIEGTNVAPWGIFSDGETMWVLDADEAIYSYNMPVSANANLAYLRADGALMQGFEASTATQNLGVPNDKTAPTVTIRQRNLLASFTSTVTDSDTNKDGDQIDLSGSNTASITASVTALDGVTSRSYTITVGRVPAKAAAPTVSAGTVSASLDVTWTAPDMGSSAITSYDIRYIKASATNKDKEASWTVIEDAWTSGALSYSITGLDGVQYFVQVRAVNAHGHGEWPAPDDSGKATPVLQGSSEDRLSALSAAWGTETRTFPASSTTHSLTVPHTVEQITVTATPMDSDATVELLAPTDADDNTAGYQVDLEVGANTVRIQVTAPNGSDTRTYTITVTRTAASGENRLTALALGSGSLSPGFNRDTTSYTVAPGYGTWQLSLTPTTVHSAATVSYVEIDGGVETALTDADTGTDVFDVDIEVGTTTIGVKVTAQDMTTRTYSLAITRAEPAVSVAVTERPQDAPALVEGDEVSFTVSRDGSPPESLVVRYRLDGSAFQAAQTGTVTIPADDPSITVTADTNDDASWSTGETATLTILSAAAGDDPYQIDSNKGAASQTVRDNDFPGGFVELSVSEGNPAEGDRVTVTVTVSTWTDQKPNAGPGPIRVFTDATGDAASGDDFEVLDVRVDVAAGDFRASNTGRNNGANYVATAKYGDTPEERVEPSITIIGDGTAEPEEDFSVRIERVQDETLGTLSFRDVTATITIQASEAASTDATLSTLTASPAMLSPRTPDHTTVQRGSVARSVAQVTLAATPTDSAASVVYYAVVAEDSTPTSTDVITDADTNSSGLQAALEVGVNVLKVVVTAEDNATTLTYTLAIARAPSSVATLRTLSIDPGSLSPSFSSNVRSYATTVQSSAGSIEITATATSTNATLQFLDRYDTVLTDQDTTTAAGFDVTLDPGPNPIRIVVTAEDGETTDTYTLTVTRTTTLPTVSISGPGSGTTVTEGGDVEFTVTRVAATGQDLSQPLTAYVSVSEDGAMLTSPGRQTVQFEATRATATLTVGTDSDTDWEEHSTVQATIQRDSGYGISATAYRPTKQVQDDDFPASTATLSLDKTEIDEGAAVTATVTITTDRDQIPHRASGALVLRTADGTAVSPDDFTAVNQSITLDRFQREDVDDDPEVEDYRYTASTTVRVSTAQERVAEDSETFEVELVKDPSGTQVDKLTLEGTPQTVTIGASDTTEVRIIGPGSTVTEGAPLVFTVRRDSAPPAALQVNLTVSETGAAVDNVDDRPSTATVTIPADATDVAYTVTTADDDTYEAHSDVTVTVAEGAGYTRHSNRTAKQTVEDDDFPAATVAIEVSDSLQNEGERVGVTVTVTTDMDQEPHRDTGLIRLKSESARSDGATEGSDFSSLDEDVEITTFSRTADLDPDPNVERFAWVGSIEREITITDDDAEEAEESFTVSVELVDTGSNTTAPGISLDTNASSADVTIRANDLPVVTISTATGDVQEGAAVDFTVSRSEATTEELRVTVTLTEMTADNDPGTMVTPALKANDQVVVIAGGDSSATLTVTTMSDDAWDEHSTVTATLQGADEYTLGTTIQASRPIRDNDFPDATLVLTGWNASVEEGFNTAIGYRFLTRMDQRPHRGTGEFRVRLDLLEQPQDGQSERDNVADPDDFGAFEPVTFSVAEADFTRIMIDGEGWFWRATGETGRTLRVLDDNTEEDVGERFNLTAEAVTDGADPGDENVTLTSPGQITIQPSDLSDDSVDASLSALTLTAADAITTTPAFAADEYVYEASVGYSVSEITIAATATDTTDGEVIYRDGDGGALTDSNANDAGFQVALDEGENVITVHVKAHDQRYTQDYTVTIVRGTQVSITVAADEVTEGSNVVFTVARTAASDAALTVAVTVSEDQDVVHADNEGSKTVTIPADKTDADFVVKTVDDATWEAASVVTATLATSTAYELDSTKTAAEREVRDDDLPGSTLTLELDETTVEESDKVTVTVTLITDGHNEPHGGTGPFRLHTVAGTATDVDFEPLDVQITFDTFEERDIDDDPNDQDQRWVADATETITIRNDTDKEGAESFEVAVARLTGTHSALALPASPVTVTIEASDGDDATLSNLELSADGATAGYMKPAFDAATTAYRAAVGFPVTRLTVTATATDENAEVSFGTADADAMTEGHQVDLRVANDNVITVTVTAQNGNVTKAYAVTVTRTPEDLAMTPTAGSDPAPVYLTEATYDIVFQGEWDTSVTPGAALPSNAGFGPLVGAVHSGSVTYVETGGTASTQVEQVAESGTTTAFSTLVNEGISAATPTALEVIGPSTGNLEPTGQVTFTEVPVSPDFPRVTLLSRIAPTHDWFVGVSGRLLMNTNGLWLRFHEVELFPWDAGTEAGDDFSESPDTADPSSEIRSLRGVGRFTTDRIGLLTFTLHSVTTTRDLSENTAANQNIGAAVVSPVAPPADTGSISYTLAGDDKDSFTINSSGQLRTKSGVTYDHETKSTYKLRVVVTDAGPDPDLVTNVAVQVNVTNEDEEGDLEVVPASPGVGKLLTATLSDPDKDVTGETWTWELSDNGTDSWTAISGATSATYTPVTGDATKHLRVTVNYTDGEGPGKTLTLSLGQVEAAQTLSTDSSLGALGLTGVTLAFQTATTTYTASVGYATAATTITATTTDGGASYQVVDGTGDDAAAIPDADDDEANGHQIALGIGSNTIVVKVTAEDGRATTNYSVTVTRATPSVSITGPTEPVPEGMTLAFEVSRADAATDALEVQVAVTETGGDLVAGTNEATHTVTIEGGEETKALSIPLVDDNTWEQHATVTATIQANSDYTITTPTAQATGADNDFPAATAVLAVSSPVDEEDAMVTATVTITTTREGEEPHADGGDIQITTVNGTATAPRDFTAITGLAGRLSFARDDFQAISSSNQRYSLSETVAIRLVDDSDAEGLETFTVSMDTVESGAGKTSDAITLDSDTQELTVTINASDQSDVTTLSSLTLTAGTTAVALDPAFVAGTTGYTASVSFGNERITATPVVTDTGKATFAFYDNASPTPQPLGDAGTESGHQIALAVGETTFRVRVTAQNGEDTQDYVVTVTREEPVLTLTATPETPTEGDDVVFTVTRNGATSETTSFQIAVTESGGAMATGGLTDTNLDLAIDARSNSVSHTVTTGTNDAVWEEHSTITAEVTSSYSFTDNVTSIARVVRDDDFPDATATLSVSPSPADEENDSHVTAKLTITTTRAEQPHASTGSIQLSTADDTATAGTDYTALTATNGALGITDPAAFEQIDPGTDNRYRASTSVNISIRNDTDKEPDEQFTVSLAEVATGPSPTQPSITVSTAPVAVVISQSDRSSDNTLSALTLTDEGASIDLTWSTTFTPGRTSYGVAVPFGYATVTVEPTPNDADATVEVLESGSDTALDDDSVTDGPQVDLAVNTERTLRVKVTAEDGQELVYTLAITRQLPELTIAPKERASSEGDPAEGDSIAFIITRNGAVTETTPFTMSLAESPGDVVDSTVEFSNQTLIIQSGDASHEVTVPTQNDEDWEPHSTIAGTIEAGSGYTIATAEATQVVKDNDFPEAEAVLNVDPLSIAEGADVTATVTITVTGADEQPHEDGGTIQLSTAAGSATEGEDYQRISAAAGELTFAASDFTIQDIGGGVMRYRLTSQPVTITTVNDLLPEPEETFSVTMSAIDIDQHITLARPVSRTVTLEASEQPDDAKLRALAVTGAGADFALSPTFGDSTSDEYAVDVPFAHSRVTVSPELSDLQATLAFFQSNSTPLDDADGNASNGFQVDLPNVGTALTILITVTAQDTTTRKTYTLALTRMDRVAVISVADPNTEATEGDDVVFTVTLDSPAGTTGVTVNVTVAGPRVSAPGNMTVVIQDGDRSGPLTVGTTGNDVWNEHSEVTATLAAGTGYAPGTPPSGASHAVLDDDFPDATAELTVSPNPVDEGASATVAVTITTARDEEPREGGGSILVSSADDTALAGSDYTAIATADQAFGFPLSASRRVDIDDDPTAEDFRYRASTTTTLPIIDDTDEEQEEQFTVSMESVTTGETVTDSAISMGTRSVNVRISANDETTVTNVDVAPAEQGATVTVGLENPAMDPVTVHLQHKLSSATAWQSVEQDTTGDEATFEVGGSRLTAGVSVGRRTDEGSVSLNVYPAAEGSDYDIRVWLGTASVPPDPVVRQFSTLGTTPTVSRITFDLVTQTSAIARVLIANTDATEQTVRLRYREEGKTPWTEANPKATTASSVTFDLTGLTSGTAHQVQATLKADFDSGAVQFADVTTAPPVVTEVTAATPEIGVHESSITVTTSAPNGDDVHLRYRERGGDWLQIPGEPVAADQASTAFDLGALTAGATYDVEASYDRSFLDRDAVQCVTFVTDSAADQDDGEPTGATCQASNTRRPPPARGAAVGSLPGLFVVPPPSGPSASDEDFEWTVDRDINELAADNNWIAGIWSDGSTLWVIESGTGTDDGIYAYDLDSGDRVEDREFELAQNNLAPRGIWSNREIVWVADSGQDRLFAHSLRTGERIAQRDMELAPRNTGARGIWSDGNVMYVADDRRDALFAYDIKTGGLLGEYALHSANGSPQGLWSDKVTLWISNHDPKQIFAYRLPTPGGPAAEDADQIQLERVGTEEFTKLSSAGNNSPRGIWSDGDVMYVADENDDKIYTYNMPDAIEARLASITLTGIAIGEFRSGWTEYLGAIGEGVTETTVEATATQKGATVMIQPDDADGVADGHQVTVGFGVEVDVTVTSADGSRTRQYSVRLGDSANCLHGNIAVGFSLVVYEGGSIEELVACAEGRNVVSVYALHQGIYHPYIIAAPTFVNQRFVSRYPDGVPPLSPFVVKSDGPPTSSPGPASDRSGREDPQQGAALCLRGEIAEGFSLVTYQGGSVAELAECGERLGIKAFYALHEGVYTSFIIGAPGFLNARFVDLFTDGLQATTPLVAQSDGPPRSDRQVNSQSR